eukprot:EC717968.1.p2 GENE.EC717968.1~~EC717968.1.p2  ORF type:complete len:58 (-),score=0.68 EC717968.1:109-282(-)
MKMLIGVFQKPGLTHTSVEILADLAPSKFRCVTFPRFPNCMLLVQQKSKRAEQKFPR